ncbi:unnamed protein product [Paramecium sonneborni]|uniref:Uncharacterized protein n=1 Tax=Paramecium sonneborni TaxID=65129 RepID=A0A8S1Q895_9CILI|nr:unnamed protein product [Paramecium sonneborni]
MEDELAFQNLQNAIENMKRERDELLQEYQKEKTDFQAFDAQIRKMQMELDLRVAILKDKEQKLANYNKMIEETDITYNRVDLLTVKFNRLLKHLTDQQLILKKRHSSQKTVSSVNNKFEFNIDYETSQLFHLNIFIKKNFNFQHIIQNKCQQNNYFCKIFRSFYILIQKKQEIISRKQKISQNNPFKLNKNQKDFNKMQEYNQTNLIYQIYYQVDMKFPNFSF